MADQGPLVPPMPDAPDSNIFKGESKMTFCLADAECAQILLELSKSASPVTSPVQSHASYSTVSADECKLFEARDARYVQDQWQNNNESLLKKELESPADSIYRRELVKRICMDHNYHWSGDDRVGPEGSGPDPFRSYCESLKQDGPNGPISRGKERHKYIGHKAPLSHNNAHYTKLYRKGRSPAKKQLDLTPPQGYSPEDDQPPIIPYKSRYKSPCKENFAGSSSSKQSIDNGDRYHNFELLLRCLADSEKQEESPAVEEALVQEKNGDDMCHEFDNLLEEFEFVCSHCQKKFTKKRYLTKHMRRMHPGVAFPELLDDSSVSCPNCGHSVSKKNFKRHSTVCNVHITKSKKQLEMDLANCQFCGIRMRRHMLVKHLAREHCVDNREGQGLFDEDSDTSSDNSEDSKSKGDTLLCQLCEMPILRSQIRQHFTVEHSMNSCQQHMVSCQLCTLVMPKAQLVHHLSEEHCLDMTESNEPIPQLTPPAPQNCECRHSMLQRFLSGESKDKGQSSEGSVEPCPNCMSPLYRTVSPKDNCNDIIQEAARLAEITTAEEEQDMDISPHLVTFDSLSPGDSAGNMQLCQSSSKGNL